jgi:type IV pilus assembly protein PilA
MVVQLRKNAKGFTLVEVIVVAVIVAVLALVAIQLYQGYVKESRKNTAENLAASAASFANSAQSSAPSWTATSLTPSGKWNVVLQNTGDTTTFICPANAAITVTGNNITATVGTVSGTTVSGQTSKDYAFK